MLVPIRMCGTQLATPPMVADVSFLLPKNIAAPPLRAATRIKCQRKSCLWRPGVLGLEEERLERFVVVVGRLEFDRERDLFPFSFSCPFPFAGTIVFWTVLSCIAKPTAASVSLRRTRARLRLWF